MAQAWPMPAELPRLYAAASLKLWPHSSAALLTATTSAALCRGLIEACESVAGTLRYERTSAALCRGLIEAKVRNFPVSPSTGQLPRLYAAASLKPIPLDPRAIEGGRTSAALCRGLIEVKTTELRIGRLSRNCRREGRADMGHGIRRGGTVGSWQTLGQAGMSLRPGRATCLQCIRKRLTPSPPPPPPTRADLTTQSVRSHIRISSGGWRCASAIPTRYGASMRGRSEIRPSGADSTRTRRSTARTDSPSGCETRWRHFAGKVGTRPSWKAPARWNAVTKSANGRPERRQRRYRARYPAPGMSGGQEHSGSWVPSCGNGRGDALGRRG